MTKPYANWLKRRKAAGAVKGQIPNLHSIAADLAKGMTEEEAYKKVAQQTSDWIEIDVAERVRRVRRV